LAPGFLDMVSKLRDTVAQAFEDKTVSAAEAKLATGTQNTAARVEGVGPRGRGVGIHWPKLDEDLSVRGLLVPEHLPLRRQNM
jgi:hypothetical protein